MKNSGVPVSTATAIAVPATFALPAVETILKEFAQCPGNASLALNIQELHVPFEAVISVPVEAHVNPGEARNEWRLQIHAAANIHLYPRFEGTLTLLPAAERGSELQLDGKYVAPFGAIGRAIDLTILRGAAQASLHRFVRHIASRVAVLSRWTQVA